MHPFAQLNAEHLYIVLRKMDKLRGQDESASGMEKALSKTLHELRLANEINEDISIMRRGERGKIKIINQLYKRILL